MGCTNATAPVTFINGGPVDIHPSEVTLSGFQGSASNVSCNTGAGACGETSPGSASIDVTATAISVGTVLAMGPVYVSSYVINPANYGGQILELSLADNNKIGTLVQQNDTVVVQTGNQTLHEGDMLVVVAWFKLNLFGQIVASLCSIAAANAAHCT